MVGRGEAASSQIDRSTQVVELDGRFVCPGFQDAHVHPAHGGQALLSCNLLDAATPDEAMERIRTYAQDGAGWVTGAGWRYDWFPGGEPDAELLDSATANRPAYLTVADGHSGWANSAALAAAGITASTSDPRDGRITRHPDGRPQGTLHEGAMDLVEQVIPPLAQADLDASVLAGQAYLLSFGITAWQDAAVSPQLHTAYVRLAESGALVASVRGALWWEREGGLDQLENMKLRRDQSTGPYTATSIKFMLDGVIENFTARMLDPYLDHDGRVTDRLGLDMLDRESLPRIVTEVARAGFQPHFHAIGDGAVRLALDSIEAAQLAGPPAAVRPHIAHLQVVHPEDVPRFGTLDVAANVQALWAVNDAAMTELTTPFIGAQRSGWQYPFADLAAVTRLAMGSDWSVSTPDVMQQMSVATRRRPPGDEEMVPFGESQALTVEQVLTGFTAGSSWVNGLGAERGTLQDGMMADLVVLSDDPRLVDDPASIEVVATMVGGQAVFGQL